MNRKIEEFFTKVLFEYNIVDQNNYQQLNKIQKLIFKK